MFIASRQHYEGQQTGDCTFAFTNTLKFTVEIITEHPYFACLPVFYTFTLFVLFCVILFYSPNMDYADQILIIHKTNIFYI